ncbi:endo-beta-glucanase [Russula aff. rugulosa BPL654]|nr:endo-beta-glucanase [Russula aff. rugulosa BPL654]
MSFIFALTVTLCILLAGSANAGTYRVADSFKGASFFSGFSFFSQADPTHGRVNYVTEEQARSRGLAIVNGSSFILRADDTTMLSPGGNGRDSFRIISNNKYSTHVSVFDVQHMPQGCGTWPAIWELGDNWPDGGEVDIVEGVNDQVPNASSLHTGPGCTMPQSRPETGTPTGLDCYAYANSNEGCGVQATVQNNYGPMFNNNGGGWYAMERTTTFIKVWFWPRQASNVPSDVRNGNSDSINTDAWGTPTAYFPNTQCDINSKFTPSNIIINLTFCGDWAGTVYGSSRCPGTCEDYVNNNPGAFSNAYFEFNSVSVYQ